MNQNHSIIGKNTLEKHGLILPDIEQTQRVEDSIELKERCIKQLQIALDKYHSPGMSTEELKTIVRNVIENRVELPERMSDLVG